MATAFQDRLDIEADKRIKARRDTGLSHGSGCRI